MEAAGSRRQAAARLIWRSRHQARSVLRTASASGPRKIGRRRILKAFQQLAGHHSWNPRDYHLLRRRVGTMTWQCGPCNIQNPDTSDICKGCRKHWSSIWHRRSRKASRQRPASHNRPKKDKDGTQDTKKSKEVPADPEEGSWDVFPHRVPWIPTTPSTRTRSIRDQESGEAEHPLPPPPVLPTPPMAAAPSEVTPQPLTPEEQQLVTHYRALQKLGVLPDEPARHLTQLDAKAQAQATTKSLSHGHLNRLNRVQHQCQSLTKKIHSVDQEWRQFLSSVHSKVMLHAQHFQHHRGDLLESLNAKLQELERIKKEVQDASQTLLSQPSSLETNLEDGTNSEAMAQFEQLAANLASFQAAPPFLVEDDEEDEEAEMQPASDQEASEPPAAKTHLAPAPFRSPGSPGKVAQNHLKAKSSHNGKSKETAKDKERLKSATEYRTD
eukprot:Skav206441  [mRNA]  locus=scaffold295:139568:141912:- [translate_table: standard]